MAQHIHTNTESSGGWIETLKCVAKAMVELRKSVFVVGVGILVVIALVNHSHSAELNDGASCPDGLEPVAYDDALQDWVPAEKVKEPDQILCMIYSGPSTDGGPSYFDPGEPWTPPGETELAHSDREPPFITLPKGCSLVPAGDNNVRIDC